MTLNVAGIKTIRAKTFDQRRNFEFISKDQVRHHRSAGGRNVRHGARPPCSGKVRLIIYSPEVVGLTVRPVTSLFYRKTRNQRNIRTAYLRYAIQRCCRRIKKLNCYKGGTPYEEKHFPQPLTPSAPRSSTTFTSSGARTTPATAYRRSVSAQSCARMTAAITLKPPTTSTCPVAAGCGVL